MQEFLQQIALLYIFADWNLQFCSTVYERFLQGFKLLILSAHSKFDVFPYIKHSKWNISWVGFPKYNDTWLKLKLCQMIKYSHFCGVIASSDTGVLCLVGIGFIVWKHHFLSTEDFDECFKPFILPFCRG